MYRKTMSLEVIAACGLCKQP